MTPDMRAQITRIPPVLGREPKRAPDKGLRSENEIIEAALEGGESSEDIFEAEEEALEHQPPPLRPLRSESGK